MDISLIDSLADFKGLVDSSVSICADGQISPTQDPRWSLSYAETMLTDEDQLAIMALKEKDRLIALAPTYRKRTYLSSFELLGVRELGEPSDFYYANDNALNVLLENLSQLSQRITIGRTMYNSRTLPALQKCVGRKGKIVASALDGCPYIDLHTGNSELEHLLSSHLRRDLRRARRAAEKIDTLRFEICSPTSGADFSTLFEYFLKVESSNWKGKTGTALAFDRRRQNFFRSFGLRAATAGILRVAFLHIGPETAAVQFAVQSNQRYWLLKIGYDERFRRCSPGNILVFETLKYATENSLKSYEFLGHPAPWIRRWTELERATARVHICLSKRQVVPVLLEKSASVVRRHRKTNLRWPAVTAPLSSALRKASKSLTRRVSRNYISGPEAEDAQRTSAILTNRGYWISQGFWNGPDDTHERITENYAAAIRNLANVEGLSTASIKIPTIDYDVKLFNIIMNSCQSSGVLLHFDSLGPEHASGILRFITEHTRGHYGVVGCTLPGRWRRSIDDADVAVRLGMAVRVVKGQWLDSEDPELDPREGFLSVIDCLSGRAQCVRVATHDYQLARTAIEHLKSRNTNCELELLYGLPIGRAASLASSLQVPVRIYVAFGHAYLPYAINSLKKNPKALALLVKEACKKNYLNSVPYLRR